jgi:hypothetical protein
MTIGGQGRAFEATIDLGGATAAANDPAWVTANDRIHWGNGVCDRTFYDAGLADPAMVSVPPSDVTVTDASEWADLVEPVPAAVLVFTRAIEFVVSPWENVDHLEV